MYGHSLALGPCKCKTDEVKSSHTVCEKGCSLSEKVMNQRWQPRNGCNDDKANKINVMLIIYTHSHY